MLGIEARRLSVIFDSQVQDPSLGVEHGDRCIDKDVFVYTVLCGVSRSVAFEFDRKAFF